MKKVYSLIFLLLSVFLFSNNITSASTYDQQVIADIQGFMPDKQYDPYEDLTVSDKDLGVGKVQFLPDNLFYFINNIKNSVASTFALNKSVQNNLLLTFSSDKLKELEKCISLSSESCINKGLTNYQEYKNQMYSKLNKLDNKEKDNILEGLLQLEINHYILLTQLQIKNSNLDLKSLIENNFSNLTQFIKSNNDNFSFKKSIKNATEKISEGKLKYLVVNQYLETFKTYLNIIQEKNIYKRKRDCAARTFACRHSKRYRYCFKNRQ